MAQNYNAIPGMLAGVTGSGGQQAGTNGSVENVLVELAKVQLRWHRVLLMCKVGLRELKICSQPCMP